MRFDFHKYGNYKDCPRKFSFGIREVPPPTPDNKYYAVYGQLVQKFFELYSNKHIPMKVAMDRNGISRFMRPFFDNILSYSYVDWKAPMSRMNEAEFFDDAVSLMLANLDKLDLYRENMRSELKIEVVLKSGDTLVSKIDFEKNLGNGQIALYDGKTTGTIGKNVDPGQLLFYAGMYQARFKILPSELAFIYYKMQVKERIAFDAGDVRALVQDVVSVMNKAKEDKICKPTPSAKSCKYCSWIGLCKEGQEDMASRKRGPRKPLDLNLPDTAGGDDLFGF
jgi:CRISPR/Cas system-associated exonuclease Cas4 (RecB family)